MMNCTFAASTNNIDHEHGIEAGAIRLAYQIPADQTPHGLTEALLDLGEGQTIGPYPARVGAHWSNQPAGLAGYWVLVGPVPLADLPGGFRAEAETVQDAR